MEFPLTCQTMIPSSLLGHGISQGTPYCHNTGMITGPVTVTITASQRDHAHLLPVLQPLLELPNATIVLQPQEVDSSHLGLQTNATVSHDLATEFDQPESSVSLALRISRFACSTFNTPGLSDRMHLLSC
jgi:hypothetical protein